MDSGIQIIVEALKKHSRDAMDRAREFRTRAASQTTKEEADLYLQRQRKKKPKRGVSKTRRDFNGNRNMKRHESTSFRWALPKTSDSINSNAAITSATPHSNGSNRVRVIPRVEKTSSTERRIIIES